LNLSKSPNNLDTQIVKKITHWQQVNKVPLLVKVWNFGFFKFSTTEFSIFNFQKSPLSLEGVVAA
jgi:hypothetical protein